MIANIPSHNDIDLNPRPPLPPPSPCPGQRSGSPAGPLSAAGGAAEQLLLRRGLRTRLHSRLHLLHHSLWDPVRVQQQEDAGKVGGPAGESECESLR